MKIPELKGIPGDRATYIKDNGRSICKLECLKNDFWYIYAMIGNWTISPDGEYILGGELFSSSAEII